MPSQCDFSANLRAARARASLNQGQLAKAIHTAQTDLPATLLRNALKLIEKPLIQINEVGM